MAKKKVVVTTAKKIKATKPSLGKSEKKSAALALSFNKDNYLLMLAGVGLIFLGMLLMSGGHMPDANTWDESLIYSTRRTLIAPIVILLGLIVEIYAIFK